MMPEMWPPWMQCANTDLSVATKVAEYCNCTSKLTLGFLKVTETSTSIHYSKSAPAVLLASNKDCLSLLYKSNILINYKLCGICYLWQFVHFMTSSLTQKAEIC